MFHLKDVVMKKNEIRKADYRLVACQRGNALTISTTVREELRREHLRTIRAIRARRQSSDQRALAESVEWERLGDFMAASDWRTQAVRADRESLMSCLAGDYYDHGAAHYPSRVLRIRFFGLLQKAEAFTDGDRRLRRVLADDPFIRQEAERMRPTL